MFLQELAHPHMLYHLDGSCDDVDLLTVYQKCNIQNLAPGDVEPPKESFNEDNDFVLRLVLGF